MIDRLPKAFIFGDAAVGAGALKTCFVFFAAVTGAVASMLPAGMFLAARVTSFSFTVVVSLSAIDFSLALIDISLFVFFCLFLERLVGLSTETCFAESAVSSFVGD